MLQFREEGSLLRVETELLQAVVQTAGYVSGMMAGSFVDKTTGAADPGFGLQIMDFLLAPGWRDDGYPRERAYHGDLPKHYVEGPQICTQAHRLEYAVIRGPRHLAVRQWFTYTDAGDGYRAGSRWEQTLLFLPGTRYILCSETITSANTVDQLAYRLDMPGHVKHAGGDTFQEIYLSYAGVIPACEFLADFPPDGRFLYTRRDGRIPERFIRAYRLPGGAWLAGMTLDPAAPCEAWCHQRGYVCFIQENHGRPVRQGETFGAAYVIGYFDGIEEMHAVYDQYRGTRALDVDAGSWQPAVEISQD